MNTLRSIPILNRPSRPSSPSPASTQTSNTTATAQPPSFGVGGLGVHHTASEPGKPRSRSLQRQVTDRITSLHVNGSGGNRTSPPQAAQSVLPTPPISRTGTPRTPAAGQLPSAPQTEIVSTPSAGYMDVVGLRLTDSVNKACAGVDFKARKGFKKGSGWAIGEAVVKELPAPPADAYLIRAILRTSIRSLSIYITRLESLLLPALTDPTFVSPLNLHPPTATSHSLNGVQYFAVSVGHAAWETCEVLEQTLETGAYPKFVSETLRPLMDKFDLLVGKVVQPLLVALKKDLTSSLARTEGASPSGKAIGIATLPAPTTAPAPTKDAGSTTRLTKEVSSGGTSRQMPVPISLQHFASRVDGARRILEIVAAPCADDGEGWVTGVAVTVIWKGMCVIAEKDFASGGHRPPSPDSVARALNHLTLNGKGTHIANGSMPPPSSTQPHGPPTGASSSIGHVTAKLTTMLPARAQSRAPSPPRQAAKWSSTTHALISLEGLVKRLIGTMVPPSARSTAEVGTPEYIAREALHEAMEALESFRIVSSAMHSQSRSSARILASCRRIRDDVDDEAEEALDDAMEDAPAVLLYSTFIRQTNQALSHAAVLQVPNDPEKAAVKGPELRIRHPAEIWGWRHSEYERQVLGGFGPAEEWSKRVALAIKPEIERIMSALALDIAVSAAAQAAETTDAIHIKGHEPAAIGEKGARKEVAEAVEWLKCLGVLCEARGDVKVPCAT